MIAKQLNLRCYSRIFLRKISLFLSTHLRVTLALHCTLASPPSVTLHVMRVLVDLIWFPGTPPTLVHKLSSLSRCSSRSTMRPPTAHRLAVALHVQCQVVGPRKTSITVTTLERLGARVLPVVPRQLVTPREPPLAAVPRTFVGLLTCGRAKRGREIKLNCLFRELGFRACAW